ncbi:cytochrome P450 71D9-like [Humulus lupulus]|uniref:cytochrome P450 71D9-like n=1 Tax=Humulus lupulus TaxID=3486 RepID=UPI002B401325|nr:cytochrome P450 71D9-like [Humulus lupulus]
MELHLPSLPILFSLLIFLFMVVKIVIKTTSSSSKLPPGPLKLPILGNAHQLLGSLVHQKLRDLATKHGPLMHLKIGQVPTLIVSSPEYAKEVMRIHDMVFASRPTVLLAQIMLYDCTDLVFSPYGQYWRQLRKIFMQELLSTARVHAFKPIREEEVSSLVKWVASNVGSDINLTERINILLYNIVSRAACSKTSLDNQEIVSLVAEAVEVSLGFELADLFPSVEFFSRISRTRSMLLKLQQRSAKIFDAIIKEHQEKKSSESGKEDDLLDVLLNFHNNNNNGGDHGFSLTSDNLKAIIWDIFAAGIDTSSTIIDWVMAELIKHSNVMRKVQDEVREVFNKIGSTDEEGINEMKYFKIVVKETMRLHPPLPLLVPRESQEKCEINGYVIPAKTRTLVNVWAIGRDPNYWTEAECFIPERFIDSSIDSKDNDFEYIPFGAGRRICAGMAFGLINVEYPLALLLYHFDWKLPNGMRHEDLDMSESFGTTLKRKKALNLIPTVYDH